ncbi:unnamed protein product [Schistosoma margrebowiei]|uniref:BHLH domain-containing protein n=1 Tax=Schistosoma margrebowiei TaxID=48269 RepID=A0AA84ZKH4_9TREM|nr:unnamed protein product [Schistosoma margrebowiei]
MNMNDCQTTMLSPSQTSTHSINDKCKAKKYGRQSTIPLEYRDQTRRLKKQNLERRRRACISDKMNALHNLALNLIGKDPTEYHKIEKTDILNVCHSVFKNVVAIVNEQPDILERVHQLRDKFYDKLITNHSSGSKNKHNISNDENNNSNEKSHLSNYIPYNHPLKTYSNDNSNDYDMNKQCNSLNTSISNDISSQLTNHNSFQYFNAKLHSTPLISMKTLKTSKDNDNNNNKPVVTTSYSQSLDSGIEDIEDTQSINCTQSQQLLQRIFKQNYYNINQPVENEVYEQIIDLSFKKQKQNNHHHHHDHEEIHQTKEEQNVWRPYLD